MRINPFIKYKQFRVYSHPKAKYIYIQVDSAFYVFAKDANDALDVGMAVAKDMVLTYKAHNGFDSYTTSNPPEGDEVEQWSHIGTFTLPVVHE